MPGLGTCKSCNQELMLGGRGLCNTCYKYHHNHGTLNKFPRSTWRNVDLMAELDICLVRGLTVREAAKTIGVKPSTLRKAIDRARQRGNRAAGPWRS